MFFSEITGMAPKVYLNSRNTLFRQIIINILSISKKQKTAEQGKSLLLVSIRRDYQPDKHYKRLFTASRILLKSLICERNERQALTGNEHKYHKNKNGFGNTFTGLYPNFCMRRPVMI